MCKKEVAVIIGFRDWGLDRLSVALRRMRQSSIGSRMDIVVSDYGSAEAAEVKSTVEQAGGRVIRTERSGPWSRSRALNAGVQGTSAPYVITTDSDMIFSPRTVEKLLALLATHDTTVHLVQCRDLSSRIGAEQAEHASMQELEEDSFFRPRWGMGGLIAFRRADFNRIGGYDARMEVYGGEDIDFAQRLVRSGRRLNWVDDPEVRIYHIWHPPTRDAVAADPVQKAAQDKNREIMLKDVSWIRNFNIGYHAEPVASVLIATRNRAAYLMDSINSTLSQTVQDIEIVVMDDGSDDETPDILAEIDDPRVRTMRQAPLGVAAARNKLVDAARAPFVVVQDDDDIMLPWRIKAHFEAMSAELAGTYGGWVDFDNITGETQVVQGREYDAAAFMYASRVLAHGTSMLRTDVLRRFRYREFLLAGVDFNLIARLSHAGYQFRHTKHLHILRRMHGLNLPAVSQGNQKNAATRTVRILQQRDTSSHANKLRNDAKNLPTTRCHYVDRLVDVVLPYLPDHLMHRRVTIPDSPEGQIERAQDLIDISGAKHITGWRDAPDLVLDGLDLASLARLRRAGIMFSVAPAPSETVDGNGNNEFQSLEAQILPALPSSGLIEDDAINLVTICRIPGLKATASDLGQDEVRSRVWSCGSDEHEVRVQTVTSIKDALLFMSPDDTAISVIFMPSRTADMVQTPAVIA